MKPSLPRKFRFWIGLAFGALGLVILASVGLGKVWDRQLRANLDTARREIDEGRSGAAREVLADLARRWPRRGEILLLLGQCEETLGRPERALESWGQIPASDPDFVRAAESHGSVLINLGRFAKAETVLLDALKTVPAADRYPLLRAYSRLLRLEGRFVEVSDVLIAGWGLVAEPSELLQDLWQNDTDPVPVDAWRLFLDSADGQDDRVWLARARLALASGKFDEARSWLDRCKARRAEDPAVWRASLDLALATDDVPRFWEAVGKIPVEILNPAQLAELRCWAVSRRLATSSGASNERKELARLVELQPSPRALERLSVLARELGDAKEAERLQRAKAEVDRARDHIHKFIIRKLPFRSQAGELVRLSALMGRRFDEHAWALVEANYAGKGQVPTVADSSVTASRNYCQLVSDAAMASLLANSTASPSPRGAKVADRLADLQEEFALRKGAKPPDPDQANSSRLHFVDDAESVGLRFVFDNGKTAATNWLLPETLSGGVGLVDFDGDGWLDVYCIQGGSQTAGDPNSTATGASALDAELGDRLFRNQKDGTFRDVTRAAGIDRIAWGRGYGMGIAVGDYDNDGHSDLFLTRLSRYQLFHNRGDGTFEDATELAGLGGPRENPTSTAFVDIDGDGDLDLYVCHYVRWDPAHVPTCKNEKGQRYYCDPAKYERAPDHVFRNDAGRFVDVTESAGFTDIEGRGLGVVVGDLDDDNKIDIYVANDGSANFLFRNLGEMKFEEIGMMAGVAANGDGGYQAGMGVIAADLNSDGRPDLMVTNLYGEGTTLFQNLGQDMFADRSAASGILGATRYLLGFGIAAFDATNDGRIDVAITNGNVNDFRPLYPNAMPTRLYESRPGGRLVDVSGRAGPPWVDLRLGRGLAAGDLDNDGRVDFVVMTQNDPLVYFHYQTERAGHSVTFRLEGTTSNRDGVGARIIVKTADSRQVAQRLGGGSYLSAPDGRVHFGLGSATTIESVEVRWPSGRLEVWKNVAADTGYLL